MKITIVPTQEIKVQVEGALLPRTFKVESTWKGFASLKDVASGEELIIELPPPPSNPWDMFTRILGGNTDALTGAETTVVKASPNICLEIKNRLKS